MAYPGGHAIAGHAHPPPAEGVPAAGNPPPNGVPAVLKPPPIETLPAPPERPPTLLVAPMLEVAAALKLPPLAPLPSSSPPLWTKRPPQAPEISTEKSKHTARRARIAGE